MISSNAHCPFFLHISSLKHVSSILYTIAVRQYLSSLIRGVLDLAGSYYVIGSVHVRE